MIYPCLAYSIMRSKGMFSSDDPLPLGSKKCYNTTDMKRYELLPGGTGVHATASTRAGLYTAALQGLFATSESLADSDASEKIERPFKLEAADPGELMVALLGEAIKQAASHGDTYDNVSFTLVTDKKAEGAYIGQRGKSPAVRGIGKNIVIEKNDLGEWDTVIKFE